MSDKQQKEIYAFKLVFPPYKLHNSILEYILPQHHQRAYKKAFLCVCMLIIMKANCTFCLYVCKCISTLYNDEFNPIINVAFCNPENLINFNSSVSSQHILYT